MQQGSSKTLINDITAGFLVFLIALPLCLGIAGASGVPPVAGILTAIVGGLLTKFLGGSRLTIKGPAAGLIVIVLGAVTDLGGDDPVAGYHRMLAVGVVAGVIQIVLALARFGALAEAMPTSVVHGMLAAIGVIIMSKQAHVLLGVKPAGKEPLHLIQELPHSFAHLNPYVTIVGVVALMIMFGMPFIKAKWAKSIPSQLVVLAVTVPLAMYLGFANKHDYVFSGASFVLDPAKFLVKLPTNILTAITFPDFSQIMSANSIKYILMFTIVGSIESLLTVSAVDSLDPERKPSDLNKDLLAAGVANTVAAVIGGIPMISEVVRSKSNIDNGAKTGWSNFAHGAFLLLAVALIPGILMKIPLAALAGMLIFTGTRLAHVNEFKHALHVGREQLAVFVVTMIVTLLTDLLIGVAAGLVLDVIIHCANGAPFGKIWKTIVEEHHHEDEVTLCVHGAGIFTNYIGLAKAIRANAPKYTRVYVDFSEACVVDHTVLAKLDALKASLADTELVVGGLDEHKSSTHAPTSSKWKRA
jgi:MFS superfamily sulfate permease-like transporter